MRETGRMLGEILFPVLKEKGCRRLTIGGQISKAYPLFGRDLEQTLADLQLDGISPAANPDDAHLLGCEMCIRDSLYPALVYDQITVDEMIQQMNDISAKNE